MARKGTPRKRGPKRAYWCYDDVADGRERHGWIASALHVIACHRTNAHRPCLREFAELREPCDGCKRGIEVVDAGYLAVFRDDGFPCLLVLQEHTFEDVGAMEFGAPVRWSRRSGVGEPVAVFLRAAGSKWTSTLVERQSAADLVPFLSHLWGMDHLEAHIRAYFESSDKPVSVPVERPTIASEIPGTPEWVRRTQEVAAQGNFGSTWDELKDRVTKRAATMNGTHPPKKPK